MAIKVPLNRLGVAILEDFEEQTKEQYKATAFDLYSEIVQRTPVDTGRARANWNISLGSPDFSTTRGTVPRVPFIDPQLQGGRFQEIFISNGLSYIDDLEAGLSPQAPLGITGPALAAVRARRG